MQNKNQRNIIIFIIVFVIIALSSTVFNTNLTTECPTCVGILAPITYLPILIFAIVLISLIFTISTFQVRQKIFITILIIALTILPIASISIKMEISRNQSTTYEKLNPLSIEEQQLYKESITDFFNDSYDTAINIIEPFSLNEYRSDNVKRYISTKIEILGTPKITTEISLLIVDDVVTITNFDSLAQAILSEIYQNYYSNLLQNMKNQNYPESISGETTITLDIRCTQPEIVWTDYLNKHYQDQDNTQIEGLLSPYSIRSIDVQVKTKTLQSELPTTEIITFFNDHMQNLQSRPLTTYSLTYTGVNQETKWVSTITRLHLYY